MTKLKTITKLLAADVDCGHCGQPGSSADQKICKLFALKDGRWDAVGSYSTGCNQGYYRENYAYGPWVGRGDTPRQAVAEMVGRAGEYAAEMRDAGHDAILEADEKTFVQLALEALDACGAYTDRLRDGALAVFCDWPSFREVLS